jgi:Entner-Doudoroff aldolase
MSQPTSKIEQAQLAVKKSGIVAIIRGDFPLEQMVRIGETLAEAGLTIMEVTLNSQNALTAITALREQFIGSELMVGAGTVRTLAQVEAALDAGAQFLVSPNFDPASVAHSLASDVLHLPGIYTASEAQNAFAAGCRMLKLFPADIGGPAYLKAIRAPLSDIDFVPTGGIDVDNIAEFVRAGAVAVGVGGALVSPKRAIEELAEKARAFRTAWDEAHQL